MRQLEGVPEEYVIACGYSAASTNPNLSTLLTLPRMGGFREDEGANVVIVHTESKRCCQVNRVKVGGV